MSRLARVTLGGALAGAVNAWLCYAGIPEPVDLHSDFKWHLIPAGALHGGALAWFAFGAAMMLSTRPTGVRLAAAIPLGWLSGYASWIPLNRSAFNESWWESLIWAIEPQDWTEIGLNPFVFFGFVAALHYLWLTTHGLKSERLWVGVAGACAAASLGSLWWWVNWERWYFSLIHGSVWGVLVALGAGVGRVKPKVA